jgi:hypothetical protein
MYTATDEVRVVSFATILQLVVLKMVHVTALEAKVDEPKLK